MTPEQARQAAEKFVRELDDNARLLWEIPGPKDTAIRGLQAWALKVSPDDRGRVLIIQLMGDRRGDTEAGGWFTMPEVGLNAIESTRRALQGLPALESNAARPADNIPAKREIVILPDGLAAKVLGFNYLLSRPEPQIRLGLPGGQAVLVEAEHCTRVVESPGVWALAEGVLSKVPGQVWRATYQARTHLFEAHGETEREARDALKTALQRHAEQTGGGPEWVEEGAQAATAKAFTVGAGYRGGEYLAGASA